MAGLKQGQLVGICCSGVGGRQEDLAVGCCCLECECAEIRGWLLACRLQAAREEADAVAGGQRAGTIRSDGQCSASAHTEIRAGDSGRITDQNIARCVVDCDIAATRDRFNLNTIAVDNGQLCLASGAVGMNGCELIDPVNGEDDIARS